MNQRRSGILLHITSLPSAFGIGDLGPEAYKFADFLAESKQSLWQILPLNPTNPVCGNSPYCVSSAFAGNTTLISPELLVEDGLLSKRQLEPRPSFPSDRCDYEKAIAYKEKLLNAAYRNLAKNRAAQSAFKRFCLEHAEWLEDFALFEIIKTKHDYQIWRNWDPDLRDRQEKALHAAARLAEEELEKTKFFQYLFFKQWFALRTYCNEKGVRLVGDVAIYVDYNSADVWSNSGIFMLDEEKKPTHVAGVPPDYFSPTGQLWGNPLYRWDVLEGNGFDWWIRRIKHNVMLFDIIRIDHFRGLVAFWEVPAGEKTAVHGKWVKAPADNFFNTIRHRFPDFPIIAEDLGLITHDVREVLYRFQFPGMKVLLFAFGEDNHMHPYLPHTFDRNWVVYTGTHDNNTARGWFESEARPDEKKRVFKYLGRKTQAGDISMEFVKLAMMSVANTSIFPLQDVLGLGQKARMNVPGTVSGNWEWRFGSDTLVPGLSETLREMTETYGRAS